MKFTKDDFNETAAIKSLVASVNSISSKNALKLADEIFELQPFFLTVMLGFRLDVSAEGLEEIMKLYLIIWEYFKGNKNVQNRKVTQKFYEQILDRNIRMTKYIEGENDKNKIQKIYSDDLQCIQSKSLVAALLFNFQNRKILKKMDNIQRGLIWISIKTFIECFETIR